MNIKTANRLCELRKEHGLSQEQLAEKLGVSRQAVSKWERSESSPDTDNLIELAKLYEISLDDLLNGEDSIDLINENKEADSKAENDGVFVKIADDEGNTVEVGKNGVRISDSQGNELKNSRIPKEKKKRIHRVSSAISSITVLLVVIAYLALGFLNPLGYGFAHWWFLFILIPVPESIYKAIAYKRATKFAYPLFATALFCALGMFLNLWHPMWIIFVTIPLYYAICNAIGHLVDKDYDENDDDEDDDEDNEKNESE